MQAYQRDFISFCIQHNALKFGEFTLKSGRVSPYFFNAGAFNSGQSISQLCHFYAQAIVDANLDFDLLFGPAYKGIPLATGTAIALSNHYDKDVPFCFNRKEAKTHGEGGTTVGAPLEGKTLIIDDVITAGTAFRECMELLAQTDATPAGLTITLDRQERGQGALSAIQEVEEKYDIPVISIIKLENIVTYLSEQAGNEKTVEQINQYRAQYGI